MTDAVKVASPMAQPGEEDTFEPWFSERFVQPIVRYIPRAITPNQITVSGLFVVMASMMCALEAHKEGTSPAASAWFIIGAALTNFAHCWLDMADGAHARISKQCSSIGAFLDHVIDAFSVPVLAGALTCSLRFHSIGMAFTIILTVVSYNQQVAYHNRWGQFIQFASGGVRAQITSSLILVAVAGVFYLLGRDNYWVSIVIFFVVFVTFKELFINFLQFYRRLNGFVPDVLFFIWPCLTATAIYLLHGDHWPKWLEGNPSNLLGTGLHDWMSTASYIAYIAACSVRVNSAHVRAACLHTYGDLAPIYSKSIIFWTLIMTAIAVIEYLAPEYLLGMDQLLVYLPFVASAQILVRSFYFVTQTFPLLENLNKK